MRIAVISTSRIPSTTANSIQVMKVCQAYKQIGHDVTLIVPGKHRADWDEIKSNYGLTEQFPIKWIDSKKIFHRYDFAVKAIIWSRRAKVELIHTWTPQVALILNWMNEPYLLELHELPTGHFGPLLYGKILKSKNKKRFLPITCALKNLFEKKYQFTFKSHEVVISPDGVDIERYDNQYSPTEMQIRLGLQEKFSAVYTGHLYAGRGMELLIELAKLLPEINFIWVGGKRDDLDYWKKIIGEKGIRNINLVGFVKNELIPEYQAAGNVLLMPYEKNISGSSGGNTVDYCSPMKMFEYLASGRPIISSDLPVLHEVLNSNNAIFCDSDDALCWRDALIKIRNSPEINEKLSSNALKDAKRYSWINRCHNGLENF